MRDPNNPLGDQEVQRLKDEVDHLRVALSLALDNSSTPGDDVARIKKEIDATELAIDRRVLRLRFKPWTLRPPLQGGNIEPFSPTDDGRVHIVAGDNEMGDPHIFVGADLDCAEAKPQTMLALIKREGELAAISGRVGTGKER